MKIIVMLLLIFLILGATEKFQEIQATTTGTVIFDRSVYPVPWGKILDVNGTTGAPDPANYSIFPVHSLGIFDDIDNNTETLGDGNLVVHIRIIDPDFNLSTVSEDVIAQDVPGESYGPVKIKVSRGLDVVTLAYAGGSTMQNGTIDVDDNLPNMTRHLGSIHEVGTNSGIFQFNLTIRYTDGPASSNCPQTAIFEPLIGGFGTELSRFDSSSQVEENYCILKGDVLTVEYTDPMDVTGNQTLVSDSSIFDLRNGTLVTDKSAYFIEDSAILTLIDPDLDLNRQIPEIYSLDLIAWKSNVTSLSMGPNGENLESFNPVPAVFQETGDSTGIFQTLIDIPEFIDGKSTEGLVTLEYQDWNPNSGNFTGMGVENKTKIISIAIPSCIPEAGNWFINSSCKIDSDVAPTGNVTIQNSSLVTITPENSLTVASGNNIIIKYGSGILIKSGGSLKINS